MIRTFISDLGNVLLFFSHDRMYQQIGELFGVTGEILRQTFSRHGWLAEYETGRMSSGELRQCLEKTFQRPVGEADLLRAAADIFVPNPSMLDLLEELRQREMRLVMLSNTSEAHCLWIERNFDVLSRFDALVLSYEVGFVKPEAGIYQAAQNAAACSPEECFYVDDIPAYVAEGRRHGWQAEVYQSTPELRSALREAGVEL